MKIEIPETLADFTVEQFQKLDKASRKDDDFSVYEMVSAIVDRPLEEVRRYDFGSLGRILEISLTQPKKLEMIKEFEIDEHKFVFNSDILNYKVRQIKSMEKNGTVENWHKFLSLVYMCETLNEEEKNEKLKKAELNVIFGLYTYFYFLQNIIHRLDGQ